MKYLGEKTAKINDRKLPRTMTRKKASFHKEGHKGRVLVPAVCKVEDKRWCGS